MTDTKIEYLAWDSDFFKKKIGRVSIGNSDNLENILKRAKDTNYQLIYVFDNEQFNVENKVLKQYNGKLVDRKVHYHRWITELSPFSEQIENYTGNLTEELENLAYMSGAFSRFKLDKNFAEGDFYRMYKIWIAKSLDGQFADNTFVVRESGKIKGIVTLKIDDTKGHIVMIAVSPDAQGKGYGKALINTCENKLLRNGISTLEVPTQLDNIQACKFYEKCDFRIREIINVYHFWL